MASDDFGIREFWHFISADARYCVVYKMYDAASNLLYVGYTGRFRRRMLEHYRDKPWVRTDVERVEVEPGYTEAEARTREAELIGEHDPPRNGPWPRAPEGELPPYIPDDARDGEWWVLPTELPLACDGCDEMVSERHAIRFLRDRYREGYRTYSSAFDIWYWVSEVEMWEMRAHCRACETDTTVSLNRNELRNAIGIEAQRYRWRRLVE